MNDMHIQTAMDIAKGNKPASLRDEFMAVATLVRNIEHLNPKTFLVARTEIRQGLAELVSCHKNSDEYGKAITNIGTIFSGEFPAYSKIARNIAHWDKIDGTERLVTCHQAALRLRHLANAEFQCMIGNPDLKPKGFFSGTGENPYRSWTETMFINSGPTRLAAERVPYTINTRLKDIYSDPFRTLGILARESVYHINNAMLAGKGFVKPGIPEEFRGDAELWQEINRNHAFVPQAEDTIFEKQFFRVSGQRLQETIEAGLKHCIEARADSIPPAPSKNILGMMREIDRAF